MKILLQRVDTASVSVDKMVGKIGCGVVLFVGIHRDDDDKVLICVPKNALIYVCFQMKVVK